MGKSSKPTKIIALPPTHDWPELAALEAQGHEIVRMELEGDLILGSACWHMDEAHRKYLSLAIAEARRVRYPKGDKNASG